MRMINRNLHTCYYKLVDTTTQAVDSDGLYTGESTIVYTDPVEFRAVISPATGGASDYIFGNLENYDKILQFDMLDCPITTTSIIIIDDADYIVSRVAESLNHYTVAVKKVETS